MGIYSKDYINRTVLNEVYFGETKEIRKMQNLLSIIRKKCIDDRIMKEMHRGVTYWQGKGAYTNEDSLILVTVISKYEISQLKKIVKEIDPKAFIIFNDGMDVTGNFEKRL